LTRIEEVEKPVPNAVTLIVLHQGAIGDFVLTLSVLQAVRSAVGADRAVAVASAPSAVLAAGRSAIDLCHTPEQVGLHTLFRRDGRLDDRLAALLSSADWVLSFLSGTAEPVHQRLCGATIGRVVSADPRPAGETLAKPRHITSQWRAAIRRAGLNVGEPQPPVIRFNRSGEEVVRGCRAAGCGAGRKRIIVHPGSGGRAKCWPIERFVALIESLQDVRATWMLGPVECEADDGAAVIRQRVAAGRESLLIADHLCEAARRITDADLYIGNDAGMTHVAAAIGIPTIAIFGPTDPRVWRPLGDHVMVAAPAGPGDLITTVSLEQVEAAVGRLLKKPPSVVR